MTGKKSESTECSRLNIPVQQKTFRGLDLDDHMATTHTDQDGYFELHGHSHEFSTIDPKVNISYLETVDVIKVERLNFILTSPSNVVQL